MYVCIVNILQCTNKTITMSVSKTENNAFVPNNYYTVKKNEIKRKLTSMNRLQALYYVQSEGVKDSYRAAWMQYTGNAYDAFFSMLRKFDGIKRDQHPMPVEILLLHHVTDFKFYDDAERIKQGLISIYKKHFEGIKTMNDLNNKNK